MNLDVFLTFFCKEASKGNPNKYTVKQIVYFLNCGIGVINLNTDMYFLDEINAYFKECEVVFEWGILSLTKYVAKA